MEGSNLPFPRTSKEIKKKPTMYKGKGARETECTLGVEHQVPDSLTKKFGMDAIPMIPKWIYWKPFSKNLENIENAFIQNV